MRKDLLINDIKTVKLQELQECRVWFTGDGNWLLNYYTEEWFGGFQKEIFFNRDKMNYFWSLSARECDIKRVHSGIPRAMTDILCYAVGEVSVKSSNSETKAKVDKIMSANNFQALMQQQVRPLTLALGWGAFKLSIDKKLSKHPIIEFYEADKVKFFAKKGIITAVEFMDEYKVDNKEYILIERREVIDGHSTISYKLYENNNDNIKCHEVPLDTLEETKHLKTQVIKNLNRMLAVPVKYFYDIDNRIYGRSIYVGKIGIFDDLDQALSQRSRTCKLSTPVEYIDEMALERDPKTLMPITPNRYDRQYVITRDIPNKDGDNKTQVFATQPDLKLEQYDSLIFSLINMAISGIISLSTLGYNVSKKDNADAQREKEKTTIMTRNAIIKSEEKYVKEVIELALVLQEIIDDDASDVEKDFDISITYSEFANPSFETKAATLTQMWGHNAISSKMFVKILYGDSLSDEAKEEEINELEKMRYEEYRTTTDEDETVADRLERNLYRDNVEGESRQNLS